MPFLKTSALNKKFLTLVYIIGCPTYLLYAQEIIYPTTSGLEPSKDYQVKINGKDAFVYASPVPAAYCSFEMKGPVDISIRTNRDLKWVDIRPLSAGIKPIFTDSTISFRILKPCQLSIELNGSIKTPLFLFANAPEINRPDRNDKNVLFFEAGKIHYPGIVEVKSNQTVYIEAGAVVVGVIKADHAKHVTIRGRGMMDGTFNNKFTDSVFLSKMPEQVAADKNPGKYHRFIELKDCDDVNIEGITLHNSTSWQVVPINSTNVTIKNIKIVSDQASDDGIDIVRSRNVFVSNCFIRTKDDCIAVKANFDYTPDKIVDSILIEKCVYWNALWGNGLEIGFELNSAEVKNITFRNSDIIHVESGAVFSIHNAGKAIVSNILFDDIRVEDARQKLFDLAIFRSSYSEDGSRDPAIMRSQYLNGAWDGVLKVDADKKNYHAGFRGSIKNITFRNIKIIDGIFPYSIFYGFDKTHNISHVKVENLEVHGKKIKNVMDARFHIENTEEIVIK